MKKEGALLGASLLALTLVMGCSKAAPPASNIPPAVTNATISTKATGLPALTSTIASATTPVSLASSPTAARVTTSAAATSATPATTPGTTVTTAKTTSAPAGTSTSASGAATVTAQTAGEAAQKGRDVYVSSCASCHGTNGEGGVGPPLIGGGESLTKFKTAQGLLFFNSSNMPFNAPASLGHAQYLAVTAYILVQDNYLTPGSPLYEGNLGNIRL
jgi:mono/diheme cytochrome c family protein